MSASTTQATTNWITLAAMAARLRIPWARAWRLALEGQVRAEQRDNGRWFVVEADVAKLASIDGKKQQKARKGPS